MGIFIPEIGNFKNFGVFIHGDRGFFWDFLIPGFFGNGDFFREIGYPTKKPPPVTNEIKFIYLILIDFSQ